MTMIRLIYFGLENQVAGLSVIKLKAFNVEQKCFILACKGFSLLVIKSRIIPTQEKRLCWHKLGKKR